MVPVAMRESTIAATDHSRIEVVFGEVTVKFVGSVDHHSARVVLELLR